MSIDIVDLPEPSPEELKEVRGGFHWGVSQRTIGLPRGLEQAYLVPDRPTFVFGGPPGVPPPEPDRPLLLYR